VLAFRGLLLLLLSMKLSDDAHVSCRSHPLQLISLLTGSMWLNPVFFHQCVSDQVVPWN